MALNSQAFKEALENSLESCLEIVDFTGHGILDLHTNTPAIKIHEAYPEFPATQRHVMFDLVNINPFIPQHPTSGYYTSKVLIYCKCESSLHATHLADLLQSFFTCRPTTDRRWFRNISDDCITNLFTIYRSRLRPGLPFEYQSDSWVDGIEIDFTWYSGNCSKEICDLVEPGTCPVENSESQFTPENCSCDEL